MRGKYKTAILRKFTKVQENTEKEFNTLTEKHSIEMEAIKKINRNPWTEKYIRWNLKMKIEDINSKEDLTEH